MDINDLAQKFISAGAKASVHYGSVYTRLYVSVRDPRTDNEARRCFDSSEIENVDVVNVIRKLDKELRAAVKLTRARMRAERSSK